MHREMLGLGGLGVFLLFFPVKAVRQRFPRVTSPLFFIWIGSCIDNLQSSIPPINICSSLSLWMIVSRGYLSVSIVGYRNYRAVRAFSAPMSIRCPVIDTQNTSPTFPSSFPMLVLMTMEDTRQKVTLSPEIVDKEILLSFSQSAMQTLRCVLDPSCLENLKLRHALDQPYHRLGRQATTYPAGGPPQCSAVRCPAMKLRPLLDCFFFDRTPIRTHQHDHSNSLPFLYPQILIILVASPFPLFHLSRPHTPCGGTAVPACLHQLAP